MAKTRRAAFLSAVQTAFAGICIVIGIAAICFCVCFTVCTAVKGAPNIFGVYYVFVENPDFDTLPENDLFLYAPCSAADLHAGDYVAVKTVRGATVAVCIDIDDRDNYIALTFSDKDGVGAVPASARGSKL